MKKHKITYQPLPEELTTQRDFNPAVFLSHSSLDWYKLTETTRHILNQLVTTSAVKRLEEGMKEHPDVNRINGYRRISRIIGEINRDAKNFESMETMKEILEKYAPVEII